jgi:hypothetical protein
MEVHWASHSKSVRDRDNSWYAPTDGPIGSRWHAAVAFVLPECAVARIQRVVPVAVASVAVAIGDEEDLEGSSRAQPVPQEDAHSAVGRMLVDTNSQLKLAAVADEVAVAAAAAGMVEVAVASVGSADWKAIDCFRVAVSEFARAAGLVAPETGPGPPEWPVAGGLAPDSDVVSAAPQCLRRHRGLVQV